MTETHWQAIIERERTAVAEGVMAVKRAIAKREWLRLGRGSYEWDDDRWKDEFGAALDEIIGALKPLEKIARDWSDCPTDWADIQRARQGRAALADYDDEEGGAL